VQTITKGNAAEAAVLNALIERDLDVLVPFGGGHPYDLVVHLPFNLYLRVQCKAARPSGGCLEFNCRATDHGRGRVPYTGLADMFGVYFRPRRAVYLIPVAEVPVFFARLRIEPTRNNQRRRVRFATDYEIDRWTVAALGEVARDATPPGSISGQVN
jgi:PD-(D/E)XK endonuclease